ncbi:hypothetical protein GBA52_023746 [Prunus armeniaca]|nr:hypothetical protein GBA52_023746 [Prunus armeniaca]
MISTLSAFSESTPASASTRFPKMGSYFSFSQLQELELQALIFRYMLAGAAVPPELLQPIRKSLLHSLLHISSTTLFNSTLIFSLLVSIYLNMSKSIIVANFDSDL